MNESCKAVLFFYWPGSRKGIHPAKVLFLQLS